jgi:hypothetical protein
VASKARPSKLEERSLSHALWPLGAPLAAVVVLGLAHLASWSLLAAAAAATAWFCIGTRLGHRRTGAWLVQVARHPFIIAASFLAVVAFTAISHVFATDPLLASAPRASKPTLWYLVAVSIVAAVGLMPVIWIRARRRVSSALPSVGSRLGPWSRRRLLVLNVSCLICLLVGVSLAVLAARASSWPIEWSRGAVYLVLLASVCAFIASMSCYAITIPRYVVSALLIAAAGMASVGFILNWRLPISRDAEVRVLAFLLLSAALVVRVERRLWSWQRPAALIPWFYPPEDRALPLRSLPSRVAFAGALTATAAVFFASFTATSSSRPVNLGDTPENVILVATGIGQPIALDRAKLRADKSERRRLALQFAPLLVAPSTRDRRRPVSPWRPVDVGEFLKDSTLLGWDRRPAQNVPTTSPRAASDLPSSCPGGTPSPCYVITHRCPPTKGWPATRQARSNRLDGLPEMLECSLQSGVYKESMDRRTENAPAFARLVIRDGTASGSRPFVIGSNSDNATLARRTTVLIQYWYLYTYDDWRSTALMGDLRQFHEADWEAITVGLADHEPLFVAYSAHCGGTWTPWLETPVGTNESTHPVAFVAYGSQAMYPVGDSAPAPDWASCLPIGGRRLSSMTLGFNVVEHVGEGVVYETAGADLTLVDTQDAPMTFPGKWGLQSGIVFYPAVPWANPVLLAGDTGGPPTPSLQPLWFSPLRTILGASGNYERVSTNW